MFQLEFWHWWALALIFVVVEALFPVGFFAGMTVGAGIAGAYAMLNEGISWQEQLKIFAGTSIVIGFSLYFLLRKQRAASATASQQARSFIGRELTLTMAVQNGFGEIEIDGERWELKGPDMKAGTQVRIVNVDGGMLVVFPTRSQ